MLTCKEVYTLLTNKQSAKITADVVIKKREYIYSGKRLIRSFFSSMIWLIQNMMVYYTYSLIIDIILND